MTCTPNNRDIDAQYVHQVQKATYDGYPTRSRAPRPHRGRMPWIDRADPTLWTSTPHIGSNFDSFDVEGYAIERGLLSVAEVQGFWGEIVCGEIDRLLTPPTSSWIRTHVRPDPTASIANNSTEGLS